MRDIEKTFGQFYMDVNDDVSVYVLFIDLTVFSLLFFLKIRDYLMFYSCWFLCVL